ncbi:MAG: exodeoxyribonuclease VII large subunit [Muribaculaceae bacterium]|nr:exodeoxyribonuclease VII large subunit [Muribaculaceae bacterium]
MEAYTPKEGLKAYSLSEFSRFVAQAMNREPVLMGAWVVAEISDMTVRGGHCYMTLIEKDTAGTTIARMRANIWANKFYQIRQEFLRDTGRELSNGMKVMFYGGANYHINYGLSFNIGAVNPSFTMGDLERIRREILATLQREGIINLNQKLRFPDPPRKIAVISSETAAGYGDFLNQLQHNSTGVEFNVMLFPAIMQGERTAQSVISALDLIEQTSSILPWDCVVIIRGGGATTDMNGFDDLQLARRVATFPIPVVVGIGHERDRCVLDEIACVRCKTPTAVAAWLSDTAGMAWQRACDLASRIASFASERLKGEHLRIQSIETMLPALAEARIKNARLKLQAISSMLPTAAKEATSKEKIRLEGISTTLRMASQIRIQKEYPALESIASKIRSAATSTIDKERSRLDSLERLAHVLDPASTLKRGYTITRIGGRAVTTIETVNPGDVIETLTALGIIISTADEIKAANNSTT